MTTKNPNFDESRKLVTRELVGGPDYALPKSAGRPLWAILLLAACAVLGLGNLIGHLFFIPKYQKMFADFNAPLSPVAKIVIGVSGVLATWWFVLLPLALAGYVGLFVYGAQVSWRRVTRVAAVLLFVLIAYGVTSFLAIFYAVLSLLTAVRGSRGGGF